MKTGKTIGAGKHNLSVTVTVEENEAIKALAKQSDMSRNEYVLHILQDTLKNPPTFEKRTVINSTPNAALTEPIKKLLRAAERKSKAR